jgi:cytochrome d ubiquinol oxidase subunit I
MIVTGVLSTLVLLVALVGRLQGFLLKGKLWLWVVFWTMPLPIIATQAGWFAAEIGRQPWIVWGKLRTAEALSPSVSGGEVLFSVILLGLVYLGLLALAIGMMRHTVRRAFVASDSPAEVSK